MNVATYAAMGSTPSSMSGENAGAPPSAYPPVTSTTKKITIPVAKAMIAPQKRHERERHRMLAGVGDLGRGLRIGPPVLAAPEGPQAPERGDLLRHVEPVAVVHVRQEVSPIARDVENHHHARCAALTECRVHPGLNALNVWPVQDEVAAVEPRPPDGHAPLVDDRRARAQCGEHPYEQRREQHGDRDRDYGGHALRGHSQHQPD